MNRFMPHVNRNLNSYLLGVLIALSGWMGEEVYRELRSTHDAVLRMVPREEFMLEISRIKAEQDTTKLRLSSLEWEVHSSLKNKP